MNILPIVPKNLLATATVANLRQFLKIRKNACFAALQNDYPYIAA